MKRAAMVVVMDVDGVLSTGQFLYSKEGKEYKVFGAHDADGIKMLQANFSVILVTADKRGFAISRRRAKDLGCPIFLVPEGERYDFVQKSWGFENTIYIADGYHDARILEKVRFGIAPVSARREAKAAAHWVTESRAGEGAVLDAALEILRRFPEGKQLKG